MTVSLNNQVSSYVAARRIDEAI